MSEAGSHKVIQNNLVQLPVALKEQIENDRTTDSVSIVVKTNETIVPVDPVIQTIKFATSNHTEKQQVWLDKVHDVILQNKLNIMTKIDVMSDTTLSDDFDVTENAAPKIDRHVEWLEAVRSSMQTYKEKTP
jgi:hypothetical protein